jgi:hypothetical protein
MDQFQFSLWAALANMELLTIKKRIQMHDMVQPPKPLC